MKAKFVGEYDDVVEGFITLIIGGFCPGDARYKSVMEVSGFPGKYHFFDIKANVKVGTKVKLYVKETEGLLVVMCIETIDIQYGETLSMVAVAITEIEY